MNELLLTYPNLNFLYNTGNLNRGFKCFSAIVNGRYGYMLQVGQTINAIRYHGTNHDYFGRSVIVKIESEGLTIKETYKDGPDRFVPFRKLSSGDKTEVLDMCVEPCPAIRWVGSDDLEGYLAGRWTVSGWPCENLQHFIQLGQVSLFQEV